MNPFVATGLTLVLGPANSGKLGRVLGWWRERIALHPLIVVPTGPDARSLSAEMARKAGALVGQSPAVTFDGLVRLLLDRSPRYAGDFERTLLVGHLLREEPPQAEGFSPAFPGIAGAAAALLEQLGDSGRSPEALRRLLDAWAAAEPGSAVLASDVGRLLTGYSALRSRLGLADRSGAVVEAIASASGWPRPLALYGFTSFTLAQQRLIAALAQATEVLLAFDYERSRDGKNLTTPSELAFWEGLARSVEEHAPAFNYDSEAIAFLERHFMDDVPPDEGVPSACEPDGRGVHFLLASGQRNEAELAAQEVAGLVRRGVAPGEIALLVRSTKRWGRLLQDVLGSCDIPCEIDQRAVLRETGLGHAFLAALGAISTNDPGILFSYLRSPYSAIDLQRAADIELRYLRGTARGMEALAACVEASAPRLLDPLFESISRSEGVCLVEPVAAQRLAGRMLENSAKERARALDDPLRGAAARADIGADARAAKALTGSLSQLAAFRAEGRLPQGVLLADVLLPALARLAVSGPPTGSEGAVQVLTAHRARARRFRAVFVLGLVEGEFPRAGDRPRLLTASQRARLETTGGRLFSPEVDEEEPLFARAISRPWSFLFLSARDADDGGGYVGQSYFWSHCKSLLRVGGEAVVRRTLGDQVYDGAQAPSLRHYLRACAAAGLHPHSECGGRRSEPPAWNQGGFASLSSAPVLAELSATQSFSPSSLESYLRCPFAWFVERVVGVEDLEVVADDRLAGDLLHLTLRDTYRELKVRETLPLRVEDLATANEIAAVSIEKTMSGDRCPGSISERKVIGWRVRRWAAEIFAMDVAANGSLFPLEAEVSVGGTGGVDVGGLTLKGRIDRIDHSSRGDLFIVDYKSGKVPTKNEMGTEKALQVPLYMMVLQRERPDAHVIGGAYVSSKERRRTGVVAAGNEDLLGPACGGCSVTEEEDLARLLARSLELGKKAAEGMRAGHIAPPVGRTCPSWCGLGAVCRARRGSKRW